MKIAVTGGTGFIGGRLIRYWQQQGHEVLNISRSAGSHADSPASGQQVQTVTWEQLRSRPGDFGGFDAIVNLAGASINQRWTAAAKHTIVESRLKAAAQVADWVASMSVKPKVVVNASSVAIYGTSESDTYDERSPHRLVDYLSNVVEQWEGAADQIQGMRLVKIRVGLVLDRKEGALPPMALPYKLGVGGKIGSGRQWISWIHVEDMIRLIDFCIRHEEISGPVNATAPNPVTNEQFGRVLARSMHRPNFVPLPAFALKLLFGELSELLLKGQKVLPRALLEHGFVFAYPTIDEALADVAGRG